MDFTVLIWNILDTKVGGINSALTLSSRSVMLLGLTFLIAVVAFSVINVPTLLLVTCRKSLGSFENNFSSVDVSVV